ncbi:50S ribosomal protein L10 [Spiroplasma endosymbiont of Crioceris asparagi]|uniref:50S ribosomal protein L10 n=1 Tax=Spiroplasma endosymbiont of Crioceris asparagi TaxID=3066286 RepID=UPI0030D16068
MALKRPAHLKKAETINEIVENLKKFPGFAIANYKTMTVVEIMQLRNQAKKQNAIAKVYKGTLFLRALKELKISGLDDALTEQNIYIFSEESVTAPKLVRAFNKKTNKLELKAGIIEGTVLDKQGIAEVAALPSKEELYSMFASSLVYPLRQFMLLTKEIAKTKSE